MWRSCHRTQSQDLFSRSRVEGFHAGRSAFTDSDGSAERGCIGMTEKPFLPVADVDLGGNERQYLLEAFDSGWISGSGPFVHRLEAALADYCGARHGVACANGTVALHLALLVLGIGPGDEVIVPALTYVATANAVTYCGATPVFADCDPETWNITAETVRPLLSPRTRAVVVVHLYGNPVDMDPLEEIAEAHGLALVEDAAEAHGATYRGRRVGALGDIATLSFYGNKLMTTGEGGMVLTNDDALAGQARLLRGQGMDPERRYWFPVVGYNYRLTNIQCAIGLGQFEKLGQVIADRRRLARLYRDAFDGVVGVRFQTPEPAGEAVDWLVSVAFTDEACRDAVARALADAGIETRPVFPPLHMLPPYRAGPSSCPVAERLGASGLSLPTGPHVTVGDIDRIRDVLIAALNEVSV